MKVILVGGFSEIFELAEEVGFTVIGYIDNNELTEYNNYKYLGKDEDLNQIIANYRDAGFIISPADCKVRERLSNLYKRNDLHFPALISPTAKISSTAAIGRGVVIQHGVNVSSNTIISDLVKLNTYANVMHDVVVGDYSTIAPNAAIMGRVSIGQRCFIGANATIRDNITICSDVTIGAGAVVTKDITEAGTYVGVPAKMIK